MTARLRVDHRLGCREWNFYATEVIRPEQQVIRPISHVPLDQPVLQARLVRSEHDEYSGVNSDCEINNATAREHTALRFRTEHSMQGVAGSLGTVHATHVGNQSSSVGDTTHLHSCFRSI